MKAVATLAVFPLAFLAAFPAHADIYKCVAADGHVMYSNVAEKNCKRLNLEPLPASSSAPAARPAAKAPSPADFPKVGENAQKSRDNDRRRILEGELAAERKNLEQAKKELAEQQQGGALPEERNASRRSCTTVTGKDGKQSQSCTTTLGGINNAEVEERLQSYKDKVALHERNVEAIQSELARLR